MLSSNELGTYKAILSLGLMNYATNETRQTHNRGTCNVFVIHFYSMILFIGDLLDLLQYKL